MFSIGDCTAMVGVTTAYDLRGGVERRKDCHGGIGNTVMYGRCTRPSEDSFFIDRSGSAEQSARHSLLAWMLTFSPYWYQGSDPTLPYQALVSRESARL